MTDDQPGLLPSPFTPIPERRPRPVLKILVSVLVLSMGSCVGCLVVGARTARQGAPHAAATIRSITQPWDAEVLVKQSSPELLSTMPPDKMRAYVTFAAGRLGNLKECGAIQEGQWTTHVGTTGFIVLGTYFADCEFQRAAGRVTLQLIRRRHEWQVNGIFLNADALMADPPPARTNGDTK